MAIPNRISAAVLPENVQKAMDAFKEGFALLKPSLLETLSKDDLDHLAKLGEASEPFVTKGLEFAAVNPDLVPTWVNVPESKKDFTYFEALRPVDTLLLQMWQQVSSSRMEAGAEALDAINDFYKSVQSAHNSGVKAATPIYEEMKKRYSKNGNRKPKGSS